MKGGKKMGDMGVVRKKKEEGEQIGRGGKEETTGKRGGEREK